MLERGTIILYADSSSLPGVIIARGSGSKWTHCAVALGDGTAIQCEATHGGVCLLPEGSGDPTTTIVYRGDVEKFIVNMVACGAQAQRRHAPDRYDYIGLAANPLWNWLGIDIGLRAHSWNCATFIAQALPLAVRAQRTKPLAAWVPGDFLGLDYSR